MTFGNRLFDSDLWVCLTLAMLHFLWLGCAIGLAAALLCRVLRKASSQSRYLVNLTALLAMAACLPVTLAVVRAPKMKATLARPTETAETTVAAPLVNEPSESHVPRESPAIPAETHVPNIAPPIKEPLAVRSTASSPPVDPPLSLLERAAPFVAAGYIVGVLVMIGRLALALQGGRRLRLGTEPVADAELLTILARQAKRIGMTVVPAIAWCERIAVPVVVGVVRPMILLPAALASGLDGSQLEALLAHELAHLRRFDLLVNLVQRLIEAVLFFHPAVWYVSRQVSIERENACDDLVLSIGWPRLQYADALVRMAELCAYPPGTGLAGRATLLAASGESPSQFKRRVLRLLGQEPPALMLSRSGVFALLLIVAISLIGPVLLRSFVGAEPADKKDETKGNEIAAVVPAQEGWTQFGGSPLRNHATDADLPDAFDLATKKNVRWTAKLGSMTVGSPVVAGSKVLVGTNNESGRIARFPKETDLACLQCFDLVSGEFLWQYSSEKLAAGRVHDWPQIGLCSTPCVVGKRVWLVTNRCEVVCLDLDGFRDGENDGPVKDEPRGENEADVIWRFDMMDKLGVRPFEQSASSVTVIDELVLLNTSNGVDESHTKVIAPGAPSFVALHRDTGRLIWSDATPGSDILPSCPASSPAVARLGGVWQAIFAGGDGWLYGFDLQAIREGKSNLLWKFDCNPKLSRWQLGSRGGRNSLVAMPVVYEERVYISVGQSPEAGEGPGHLWCVDPTRRGDISPELVFNRADDTKPIPHKRLQACVPEEGDFTRANGNSGVVWHFETFDQNGNGKYEFTESMHRAIASVAIADDLVFVPDVSGILHCVDAHTGRVHWSHDLMASAWSTPMICRDRVYVADEDGDVAVFKLDKKKQILAESNAEAPIYSSFAVAEETLVLASKIALIAVAKQVDKKAALNKGARARLPEGEWGPAVHGVQARLVLTEAPTEFRFGEVLTLDLSVRNTSEKPVSIWLRNPIEWQWSLAGNEIRLHPGDKPVERGDWHNLFVLKPGETRVVPRKKPRVLIQPADWKGESMDYNLSILRLASAEYNVSATDVHVLKALPENESEPMPLTTGKLSMSVIDKSDIRPPVPARITEGLAKISWGEAVEGLRAGIAWAADDELNNGDSCELFFRNVGERELAFSYVRPPYDSWLVFGVDKEGKRYPPGKRFFEGGPLPVGTLQLKPGEAKRFATPHVHDRNSRPGTFPDDAGIVGREGAAGFPDAEGGYRFELKFKTGTLDLRSRPKIVAAVDALPPRSDVTTPEDIKTDPPPAEPQKDAPVAAKKGEIAWGETTGGLQFGLSFPGGKNRFRVRQTLSFVIHARNRTEKAIDVRYDWPSFWGVERTGEQVAVFPMFIGGLPFTHRVTLKPGEERELPESADRPTQEVLLAPRDVKIEGEPFVALEPETKAKLVSPAVLLLNPERDTDWRGKAATGSLPFEVVPSDSPFRQVDASDWGKPIAWPAKSWEAAPLPKTWDKAELWKRLTKYLLSRTEKEFSPYSFEERDGRIKIEYKTRQHHAWRSGGKVGGPLVRRTESGPRDDGLRVEMWLADEPGQAERPQTLENDPWRTYLGQVDLPELKTHLEINVSYGVRTDVMRMVGFVSPRDWLTALEDARTEKGIGANSDAGLSGEIEVTQQAKPDAKDKEPPEIMALLRQPGCVFKQDADGHVVSITVGGGASDEWLAKIKSLTKLKRLYIETSKDVAERGLSHIAEIKSLESLEFYSVHLPDGALAPLVGLPKLSELSVTEAKLTDAAMPSIGTLVRLKKLRLKGNQLTDAGMEHLKNLRDLEVLDIAHGNWVESRMRITDAGLAPVANFTRLRELELGGLPVGDDGFAKLGGLSELRILNLAGTQITGKGLQHLKNFPQLESLMLAGRSIDNAGLAHVGKCSQLEYLALTYTNAGDEGLRQIAGLKELKRLTIDSRVITDAGLAHLVPLTKLEHVELRASKTSDEGLRHLSNLSALTRLDLSGSGEPGVSIGRNYTGAGYAHLAKTMKLKTLYLTNADVMWTELRDLKQLHTLSMMMPTMSQADVRELQKALPDTFVSAAWGGSSVAPRQLFDEDGKFIGPPGGAKRPKSRR